MGDGRRKNSSFRHRAVEGGATRWGWREGRNWAAKEKHSFIRAGNTTRICATYTVHLVRATYQFIDAADQCKNAKMSKLFQLQTRAIIARVRTLILMRSCIFQSVSGPRPPAGHMHLEGPRVDVVVVCCMVSVDRRRDMYTVDVMLPRLRGTQLLFTEVWHGMAVRGVAVGLSPRFTFTPHL